MTNLHRVKKNAIFISAANTWEHELGKFRVCYNLKEMGHNFLTEAECSINKVRYRRDVVDLTDGRIYEIETDPKRAERFIKDPEYSKIIIIKLWSDKNGS